MAGLPGIPNPANLASMAMRLPQQLPSMIAPTFDVNELDKRIADLRAVEQWLELNWQHAAHDDPDARGAARDDRHAEGHQRSHAGAAHQVRPEAEVSRLAMPPFPMPPPEQEAEPAAPHARKSSQRRHKAKPAHAPTVTEAPLNPTAWWNTLQDQFTKIAASAAAGAAAGAAQAPAKKSPKSAGTRRARKAGKGG